MIPIILLGGYFGFRLANEIFGYASGVVFLLFWTFSPLVLAWGATISPDACAAAVGIIGIYTFRQWLYAPNWMHALMAGVCLGLMVLMKLTWIGAFPLWLILWLIWTVPYHIAEQRSLTSESVRRKAPIPGWKQMAGILFIAIYVINMVYFFDGSFQPLHEYRFRSQVLSGTEHQSGIPGTVIGNRFAESWSGYLPVPFPAELVRGIDTQQVDFERGMESYLYGEYAGHGWWYYYICVIFLKEPSGILCLFLMAVWVTISARKYNASWRDEMLLWMPGLFMFTLISSQTGFSANARYVLPALPFLYLWISKTGQIFVIGKKRTRCVVALLLTWIAGSSLYYYPFPMAYFNELIGGPRNGPKYLLGSNIDWGQNAYFLKKWCESHPEARPIRIIYASEETPERLRIEGYQVDRNILDPGWYMIGVNQLYDRLNRYECFRKMIPIDHIGNSIFIYHLAEDHHPEFMKKQQITDGKTKHGYSK